MSYIYILKDKEQPHVKIGVSKDPVNRSNNLPDHIDYEKSYCVFVGENVYQIEKALHITFDSYSVKDRPKHDGHTEWFSEECSGLVKKYLSDYHGLTEWKKVKKKKAPRRVVKVENDSDNEKELKRMHCFLGGFVDCKHNEVDYIFNNIKIKHISYGFAGEYVITFDIAEEIFDKKREVLETLFRNNMGFHFRHKRGGTCNFMILTSESIGYTTKPKDDKVYFTLHIEDERKRLEDSISSDKVKDVLDIYKKLDEISDEYEEKSIRIKIDWSKMIENGFVQKVEKVS